MTCKSVLVIDDEEDVRNILAAFLKKMGHSVVLAEEGPSGLQKLREQSFDLVICDMRMRGMDGLEVVREAIRLRPDARYIISTGATDQIGETGRPAGPDAWLIKPFNRATLAAMVERFSE